MSSHEIVGIDIAAKTLTVAGEGVALRREYANDTTGRGELVKALRRSKRPVRVVLEATGIYFLDLACALATGGIEVMVVNPRATHHFAEAALQRRKDDPVDAAMLREYGVRMPFLVWAPPTAERFALRAIAREARAQTKAATAAKNRLHAMEATSLVPRTLKRALEREIARIEALVDRLIREAVTIIRRDKELNRKFALTDSVPGVAAKTAVMVMSELLLLPPMSAAQWVAQAGLDVREIRSGSSVTRPAKISKRGNKRLREALFYPALTAAQHCPAAAAFVSRLTARGKTPLQAQVALMRKLLHAIHAMWKNDEVFDAAKLFAPL
jgi:transposase